MDIQDWVYQVSTSLSAAQSSSPPTSPIPISGDFKRKRRMSAGTRGLSPSKRRRKTNVNEASSQISDLSDRTQLPSTSSVPSRQGSPTRDIFNELRRAEPPIVCETGVEGDLPPNVEILIKYLTGGFGQNIVPQHLKPRVLQSDRLIDIPESAYSVSYPTEAESELLWEQLDTIRCDARDCDIYGRDESAWCQEVVHPLVSAVLDRNKLRLISVQSQQIDVSLLPVTANTLARLNKKADYAFAFSWHDQEVSELYQKVSLGGHGYRISQTNDAFTKRITLFSGVEVKPEDGGKKEALAQLAIWLTANFQRQKSLYQIVNGEVHDGSVLPVPGFTIIGHDWHTFIAYSVGKDIRIVGPISTVQADTRSIYGIFKLRDLLRRVERYASEVYWPWVRDEILQPLATET